MKKILFALVFLLTACDHTWQNLHISTQEARRIIKYQVTHYHLPERVFAKTPVTDEKSAVLAAEEILFPMFGKHSIRDQRPYTVGSADGYWVISGYPPPDFHCGVFEIVLYAKTGEVVYLIRGK